MYDAVTAELISSTPPLEDLDRASLPDLFSETFSQIAAARIRLRELGDTQSDRLSELIGTMRRLAHTNEALVAVLPEREDRAAAAFVAATAHQLAAHADRQLAGAVAPTHLSQRSVSSDIAAMLLFMVAEAMADAAEMARKVWVESENAIEAALINALKDFASGRLEALTDTAIPRLDTVAEDHVGHTANGALYQLILEGVQALARQQLDPGPSLESAPIDLFERARSLSLGTPFSAGQGVRGVVSSFPGPYHLASLLVSVSRDVADGAVIYIDPPPSLDPNAWAASMRQVAKSRPFLWRNHRKAIAEGYLEPGVSAVVGFPTGAGKSTLAELKITTALLTGNKVVFIAPTNALVDQTSASLRKLFPKAGVQHERADEIGFPRGEDELSKILVMTPEACLTQMSMDTSVFEGVSLFVFDECHLLHPTETSDDRRAIDAMLCIVNFAHISPRSDFLLLSAMMKNADTVAGWIAELTGRHCLALDLPWKPTRQLRGSVVYPHQRVSALEQKLRTAKRNKTTNNPPAALKRELTAEPLALFSLKQTWASRNTEDYVLVSLLDAAVTLGANAYWKPTPNAVAVTADITVAATQSGVKALAFFQTIKNATSAAKRVCEALGRANIALEPDEVDWLATAVLELGDAAHLYIKVDDGRVIDQASVHHGLLLPEERRLCEALYRREGGLKALTATSTLAQGMNLPCELVIIGEDSRFDREKDKRKVLEAQELLNAAGRAGRAGNNAAGVVLVVPGQVVGVDFESATIGDHWGTLREIFGQSDQCLEIDDPLTAILDRVHVDMNGTGEIERYAVARLVSGGSGDTSEERLSHAIGATFAAYRARQRGDTNWLDERKASAAQYLHSQLDETEEAPIEGQVAAGLGLSLDLVRRLSSALSKSQPNTGANVPEWRRWFFRWLADNPDLLEKAFRQQNLVELFGKPKYDACLSDQERVDLVLPSLERLTGLWMKGKPLKELELAIGTEERKLKTCDKARRFAVRIVPDLAYLFGLPALLHDRTQANREDPIPAPPAMAQLARCARIGLNFYEEAGLNQVLRPTQLSRRQIHRRYAQLKPYLEPAAQNETWNDVTERIEQAIAAELAARQ